MRADGQYPYTLINGELRRERSVEIAISMLTIWKVIYSAILEGGELSSRRTILIRAGLPVPVNLYNKNTSERLWDNNFSCNQV